jgi:anti-sigma B factor antagonist
MTHPSIARASDIPATQLTIVEHHVGRRAVLSVGGELDISTADDLRAAIELTAARAFEVWVDLSDTPFMDSSGLHALAECRARLAESRRRLVLICPEGPVLRVLKLTGVDQMLEVHATRSAANNEITAAART